ncbi:MAG: ABC transporter permease subunit [Firmicutes bacterium]|nr:ABC transporter permease subunit [Bacillota bacterium]
MNVLVVAALTLLELTRRRVLVVLVTITLVTVALSGWGLSALWHASFGAHAAASPGEMRLAGSQELVLFLFMFSGVVVLTAVAAGAPAVAAEVEAGTLPAFLARPLGRWEVVLGKWLGLAAVLVPYIAATGALELWVVLRVVGYRAPAPAAALAALVAEGLAVMSLALLLGTRLSAMAAGVVAAAAFFVSWAAGVTGGVGEVLHNRDLVVGATVAKLVMPSDGLWRSAVYHLEPPLALAAATRTATGLAADPFFVASDQPLAFYLWAAAWIAAVVALAVWSFRRREL